MSAHKVLRGGSFLSLESSMRAVDRGSYSPASRHVSTDLRLVATVPGGASRVLRGGSFGGYRVNLRAAHRLRYTPVYRDGYVGFRLAATRKEA